MRRILLAMTLVFAVSCAKDRAAVDPDAVAKKERPLWWVLQKKEAGASVLDYEDRFFRYEASFEYIPPEKRRGEDLFGQCPIERAEYRVTDKESRQVVRLEHMEQLPCENCHRR